MVLRTREKTVSPVIPDRRVLQEWRCAYNSSSFSVLCLFSVCFLLFLHWLWCLSHIYKGWARYGRERRERLGWIPRSEGKAQSLNIQWHFISCITVKLFSYLRLLLNVIPAGRKRRRWRTRTTRPNGIDTLAPGVLFICAVARPRRSRACRAVRVTLVKKAPQAPLTSLTSTGSF